MSGGCPAAELELQPGCNVVNGTRLRFVLPALSLLLSMVPSLQSGCQVVGFPRLTREVPPTGCR